MDAHLSQVLCCIVQKINDIALTVDELNAVNAPSDATYITQTPNATLSGEQSLSLLATGYLRSTTGTGVVSSTTTIPAADLTGDIARARINTGLASGAAPIVATTLDATGDVYVNSATAVLRFSSNANTQRVRLYGLGDGANDYGLGMDSSDIVAFFGPGGGMTFKTSDYDGTSVMRIKGDGTVGIGQASPSAKLHVESTTGPQFIAAYDGSNRLAASVNSVGGVTFDAVGSGASFTFNENIAAVDGAFSGAVVVGGGTAISKVLSATAVLDFPETNPGEVNDLTMTVTGAAVGDVVSLGVPHGSMPGDGVFFAWVSAADTVQVRFCNQNIINARDPSSGTFRVMVTKF